MQSPKQERLWFIFFASSNYCPLAPVLEAFSLPAKSTRLSLETFIDPSSYFCSRI